MELLIKAVERVNNFYMLAAVGIIASIFPLYILANRGRLSKIGVKDSYKFSLRSQILISVIILAALILGKNSLDRVASDKANQSTDTSGDDLAHISQDVSPLTSYSQLRLQPTPQSAQAAFPRSAAPLMAATPSRSVINEINSTQFTREAPQQQAMRQDSVPVEAQKQLDPFIQQRLQTLKKLSDSGVRIEKLLSPNGEMASCMTRFTSWSQECVKVLDQIDDYFDSLGHPTDFAGYFEHSTQDMIPKELQMVPSSEGFAQCQSGFQTSAEVLLNTIEMNIKSKAEEIGQLTR